MISIKNIVIASAMLFFASAIQAQPRSSMSSDFAVLRSFKEGQRYWAVGQTVRGQFNLNPNAAALVSFSFFSNGHFKNNHIAEGTSPISTPQQFLFENDSRLRMLQFSIGARRYITGNAYDQRFNTFLQLGLGIIFNTVTNTFSEPIDTFFFDVPVREGTGRFNRLTIDPSIGAEYGLGGDCFVYMEGRMYVPVTNYPSPYMADNQYTPLTGTVNIGVRILF